MKTTTCELTELSSDDLASVTGGDFEYDAGRGCTWGGYDGNDSNSCIDWDYYLDAFG